jgi:branched-chain amino acid transport system permease protein
MTVLGGFSSFLGPIVGALALTLLQDQLQSITQYWRFVLGAILAAMVIFFPRGLAGIASDFAGLFSRRKREAAA